MPGEVLTDLIWYLLSWETTQILFFGLLVLCLVVPAGLQIFNWWGRWVS